MNLMDNDINLMDHEIPLTLSWLCPCLSFPLKSPVATSKHELFSGNFSEINSKFCENDKKSS